MEFKVCGMGDKPNTQQLVEKCLESALPLKRLGFIFYPKSSRFALQLKGFSPDLVQWVQSYGIEAVAVSVGDSVAEISQYQKEFSFDAWQLHGGQSVEFIKTLKQSSSFEGVKMMRALSVSAVSAVDKSTEPSLLSEEIKGFEGLVDEWLFDTKTKAYGGSGVSFDWDKIPKQINQPFWLSGGLRPEIEGELLDWIKLRQTEPFSQVTGLDLNSGFEQSPAIKRVDKIVGFMSSITSTSSINHL